MRAPLTTLALLLAVSTATARPAAAAPAPPPAEAKAAKALGDQRRKEGDLDGALEAYRSALKLHGGYAEAHEALGEVHFAQKHLPDALQSFGTAAELDPAYALAWYNLGFAAARAGDAPRARAAFERYAKLRPADPDGHYRLAETLRGQGEREAAVREYQLFMDLARSVPGQAAWVERAKAALVELKPAPARAVAEPTISARLAVALEASPPPVVASTPTSTSTPTPTPTPAALRPSVPSQALVDKLGAGDRSSLAGDHRAALFAYQDAVYLDPSSAAARVRLAKAYAALRHPAQAEEQLHQALALEPGNAEAQQALDALKDPLRQPVGGAAPRPTPPPTSSQAAPPTAQPGAASLRVYKFVPEPEAGVAPAPAVAGTPAAGPAMAPAVQVPAAALSPTGAPPALAVAAAGPTSAAAGGKTAAQHYRTALDQIAHREFAEAVDELDHALALDPNLAVAVSARASARYGLKQYAEAAADYEEALQLDPRLGTPLWGLAECYRLLGDRRAGAQYDRYARSSASDVREDLRELARRRAKELGEP